MSNPNDRPAATEHWHRRLLEGRVGLFALLTTVVISIGGIVEIVPMFSAKAGPQPMEGVTPLSPLEVAGRDIYIREGCYVCHSQMVRPMRAELQRYGEWTRAGELAYERPFLLGSRRIGPDLQRVGGKYPDAWHYEHMRDPRSTSPGSIMPGYPWLLTKTVKAKDVYASLVALERLGVPYIGLSPEAVAGSLLSQAGGITRSLASMNIEVDADREIVALIAYLQRLGRDGRESLARDAAGSGGDPANPHRGLEGAAPPNPHGGENDPAAGATPGATPVPNPHAPPVSAVPNPHAPPAAGGSNR